MSRSSSEREYDLIEEMKKLTFYEKLLEVEKASLVNFCESYAEQKIKQMFDEENNRNEGKIKVRTENGILMLTPGEFEEYKKTIEEAILRVS